MFVYVKIMFFTAARIHEIFNTWLSTPKKQDIPGHANHVLKSPL
jgi:hypothetical protein